MKLIVHPDLRVEVLAPYQKPVSDIHDFVHRKAAWIMKKRKYLQSLPRRDLPLEYVNGETHYFMGEPFSLIIEPGSRNSIRVERGSIVISSRKVGERAYNRKLMYKWLKERAEDAFQRKSDRWMERLSPLGIKVREIRVRAMKSRWGSCHAQRKMVIFNTFLIRAPLECIDYVVLHELCHLKYPGHGRKFYTFLSSMMPDWKERKKRLNDFFLSHQLS